MRKKLPALLLILFSLAAAVNGVVENTPSSLALPVVNNVTLLARLDKSVPAYGGMILSPSPQWSGQQVSDAYGENVFTLYPILGQRLKILGTVLFRVWLRSDSPTFGKATFSLFELSVNGELKEITRTEGYVGVNTRSSDFNFAIASVNGTIEPSSALQFRFTYSSTNPKVRVYLLWNDPQTPTQIVVPCVDHIILDLSILDKNGKLVSAYNANQTGGQAGVWVKLGAVDPFGLTDLRTIAVSVSDSMGNRIVESQPMSLDSSGASFYSGVYVFNASFVVGRYSVVVKALDMSGNAYYLSKAFAVSHFYAFQFILVDEDDHPLSGANYTVSSDSIIYAVGSTNASGWAVQQLPSSNVVGRYNVAALWKNVQLTVLSELNLSKTMTLHLKANVFKVTARCVLYGIPLSGATVYLLRNSSVIANAVTGLDGSSTFYQIPPGEYVVRVSYMSYQYETRIFVEESYETLVTLEIPYLGRMPYVAMSVAVFAIIIVFIRRRQKLYPATISALDNLVEGGLPQSATIMILGPSASGKTVLLENLMHTSLSKGRPCVFIATMEFPSEIRKEMKALGFDTNGQEKERRLAFIDCYSAAAGKTSDEKYSISSITDLTRLGTELSTCLESFGKGTDVFLDSVAPWVAALKPEFIISFIHATGAKVKAGDGRFYFTVGTSVQKEFLTKIDEASDGVIELRVLESEKEPRRKLAIRKIRGRKHSARWLNFSIVEGKGIVFQIRGRAAKQT
jgi:KaiC/GvpD/RAD55 family RecA-like ATPase